MLFITSKPNTVKQKEDAFVWMCCRIFGCCCSYNHALFFSFYLDSKAPRDQRSDNTVKAVENISKVIAPHKNI